MDDIAVFDVLVASPHLATWVSSETYRQNKAHLDALNATGHLSKMPKNKPLLCRAFFKDTLANWKDAVTLAVSGAGMGISKGPSKAELLTGVVLGGKCIVPYKDPALGTRFPHVAKYYQVLILQQDYGNIRGERVAVKHLKSGLCLGDDGKKPVLTSCERRDSKSQLHKIVLTKEGYLARASEDGAGRIKTGKCLLATPDRFDYLQWGDCAPDPRARWFINAKKNLSSGWGTCAYVNPNIQKPGGGIYLHRDCAKDAGKDAQWQILPLVQVMVSNDSPAIHNRAGISGSVSISSVAGREIKNTQVCSTKGCAVQPKRNHVRSWHMPGETVSISIAAASAFKQVHKFSRWTNGYCAKTANPCTFKIDPKKNYTKAAFYMDNVFKRKKMDRAFTVQHGNKCLTLASKGNLPEMQPCKKDNIRQIFVNKSGNYVDMLRASMMAGTHCLYPPATKTNSNRIIQAPTCGRKSHELPKGGGFPYWHLSTSGHMRLGANSTFCAESSGKNLIKAKCDVNRKAQMFKFVNAAALKGNLMQVHASGRCIDNTGATKKGVQIHAYTCNRKNKNQEFVFMPGTKTKAGGEIRVAKSGLCLDVAGTSKKDGAKVHQWPCHGKANQRWRLQGVGHGWSRIVSVHSGKCLDLQGGHVENRVKFIQYKCGKDNRAQKFRNVADVSDAEIKKHFEAAQSRLNRPGPRIFVSRYSGKCIDNTSSKSKGVQMHQFKCYKGLANQQFMLIDRGDGFSFGLKNVKSGLCLNVSGESKKNGAKVIQWPCSKSKNATFWFDYENKRGMGSGWFKIRAEHSNKCIDIRGPSRDDRAKIQQWECKNVNQHWFKEYRG